MAKYLRKISPAKSLYRKTWRECEAAWKAACLRRDNGMCALHLNLGKEVVQVDHFISRKKKATFFDPRNGTTVCRADNMLKAFGDPVGLQIAFHVERREGREAVSEMISAAQHPKKWTITELESQIEYLNSLWLSASEA